MRRLSVVIAACAIAVVPAVAEQTHDHSAAPKKKQGMHEHMKLMREQMAQIRGATDPKERERLMNEHMKAMEQSMSKMDARRGCHRD